MASYHQYETANGKKWLVRFRIINENGEYVNKSMKGHKTKKSAEAAYLKFMESYVQPTINPERGMTFGQLCVQYLEYAHSTMKESSAYEVECRIRNHLLPTFNNKPVAELQAVDVLNWQNSLAEYSQSYKVILRRLFNSIIIYGEKYHNIDNKLTNKVDMPRSPNQATKEMQVWTVDEFKAFHSALDPSSPYALFFEFLFLTGCRKGEATALAKDDVSDGVVKISKSLTRKVVGAPYKIVSPKNAQSVRSVTLPKAFTDKLKALANTTTGSFLFGGVAPLSDSSIDKTFSVGIQNSGVKKIRIHDIRHTHASMLISNGVSIVAVSSRLGHKDVKETLNTYAHFMPSDNNLILTFLNGIGEQIGEQK